MELYTFNKGGFLETGVLRQIMLVMKVTTILIFAFLMQVSAAGLAQKITLNERNASLESVIDKIRSQTGYEFMFNVKDVDNARKVNININGKELNEALKVLFEDQALSFSIKDKFIVLKPKESSLFDRVSDAVKAVFKNIDVRGSVIDEQGKPLPNASIRVKGKDTVINTNEKGEFVMKGLADDAVLIISYIGYKQLELPLKGTVMPLKIKLNQVTGELEEVKVTYNTGYQSISKERATGSFVQIDNELFNRRVGTSILDRLVDVTSGLLRTPEGSGNPLDGIRVRGESTINSSKRPLLVVDNFIYEGDISAINVNDVESVTVLRDAAASSIWGARAGNGVIVITMKKGKFNSRNMVSLRTDVTLGAKPNLFYIPSIPSKDIIALERKRFADSLYNAWDDAYPAYNLFTALPEPVEILLAQRRGVISTAEAEAKLLRLENHDIRDDISKYLHQTSVTQQYNLNISGGSSNYRYYGSGGFNKIRPNEINYSNQQTSLRFNQSYQISKKLEVNAEINWNRAVIKNSSSNYDYLSHPYSRLADEKGNALAIPFEYRLAYLDTLGTKGLLDWHFRPLEEASNGNRLTNNQDMRIGGSLNYKLFQSLKISANYQWLKGTSQITNQQDIGTYYTRNLINSVMQTTTNGNPMYPYPLGAAYDETNTSIKSWDFRGQLNWDKIWGAHALNSLAGVEIREAIRGTTRMPPQFGLNLDTYIFSPVLYGDWVSRPIGSLIRINPISAEKQENVDRFGSYYANLGYSYQNKYFLSTNGRIDKSNFFGVKSNDRIRPLWHIGVAWSVYKEDFYDLNWLPLLKLRATYGYSGNTTPVSPLATANILQNGAPLFLPIAYIVSPPNPQLRWERVKTVNLAMDFGLDNNRLTGSVEVYHKTGLDLISSLPIDATSGFRTYQGNNASIKGKGFDISLNSINVQNSTFKWQSFFILSHNTEKVTSYYFEAINPTAATYINNPIVIGRPLLYLNSYRWAGLNSETGDSQIYVNGQVVGSNDGGKAKQEDLVYHGRVVPSVFGSLRNDLNFLQFSLSINVAYRLGYVFRRSSFSGMLTASKTWEHADYLKAWKAPGDEKVTNVPGFQESYNDQRYSYYLNSDILVEKGDHVRLQDIRLSYSFQKAILQKLNIAGISIYMYMNNVGLIWKANKQGLDPDFRSMPPPRTLAFGLQVAL